MPKRKATPFSRNARGGKKKAGKHGAKKASAARTRAATAAPAAAEPEGRKKKPERLSRTAFARAAPAEQKTDVKSVGARKRMRHSRAKRAAAPANDGDTAGTARKRKLAAAAAALPKGLGATAQGRHSAFARESGNVDAARQAAERAARKAAAPLEKLYDKGEVGKVAAVLGDLVRRPKLRQVLRAADVRLEEDVGLASKMMDNVGELAGDAARGSGNKTYEQHRFVGAVCTAVTNTVSPTKRGKHARTAPDSEAPSSAQPALSISKMAETMQMSRQTLSRHMKAARVCRRKLSKGESDAYLIDMRQRLGPRKATEEVVAKLWKWLETCKYIRVSPIAKDALLVRGLDGKKNVRVPRLWSEVSVLELYTQAKKELNLPFKSLRTFKKYLPPQLRRLTQRRESCGCPHHLKMHRLHSALVHFRARLKKTLGKRSSYKPYEHAKPSLAISEGLKQSTCFASNGMRRAKCWMNRRCACGGIKKRYKIPKEELAKGSSAPKISFSTYQNVEHESKRYPLAPGEKPKKKMILAKDTLPIGKFMEEHYIPELTKYDYHHNLINVLNLCSKSRRDPGQLDPGDADDECDFAQRMEEAEEGAPQSDHWVNKTVGIETGITRTYTAAEVDAFIATRVRPDRELKDEHHFALTDYHVQDSSVVDRNMAERIGRLKAAGRLKRNRSRPPTVFQDVDGCAGQYWSAPAAARCAKRARDDQVIIDRARDPPGHGKKKADGAHAVVKRDGKQRMRMQADSDEECDDPKPKIESAVMVDGQAVSYAESFHDVCQEHLAFDYGETPPAAAMRKDRDTMEARRFSVFGEADVTKNTIAYKSINPSTPEERRQKLPYSTWKAYHNLRADPALQLDEAMLRRWPCKCPPCRAQLLQPTAAARYKRNPECVLEPMAEGLNDWCKVKFVRKAAGDAGGDASDDSDDDDALLLERADAIADYVMPGEPGLIDAARDRKAAGDKDVGTYYSVHFKSCAYELEEDYNSPDYGVLEAGARVLKACYNDLVYGPNKTPRWYTPNPAEIVVPVELVLHASFEMAKAELPPKGASPQQKQAVRLGARVLSEADHEAAMEELRQRAGGE